MDYLPLISFNKKYHYSNKNIISVEFDCSGTKNCLFVLSSTQIYDECVCFIDACAYYITTCYEGGDRCDVSFS